MERVMNLLVRRHILRALNAHPGQLDNAFVTMICDDRIAHEDYSPDLIRQQVNMMIQEGLITGQTPPYSFGQEKDERQALRITQAGQDFLDEDVEARLLDQYKAPPSIVHANCNNCGGERNAFIRTSYRKQVGPFGPDDPTWSVTTIEALECCGCNQLSMRRRYWFSEWDPMFESEDVLLWPPKQSRAPDWHNRLLDDNLRQAMQEVYVALNQRLVVLASIGVRTLLDRSFFLLLGDDHGSFATKLNVMVEKQLLLESEKEIFQSIAGVGSAAAHRAHVPTPDTLITILRAVESFLYQKFILPDDADAVEKTTPSQPDKDSSDGPRSSRAERLPD